jgi:hypothetical protein
VMFMSVLDGHLVMIITHAQKLNNINMHCLLSTILLLERFMKHYGNWVYFTPCWLSPTSQMVL